MNMQNSDEIVIRAATNDDREQVVAHIFSVVSEYRLPPDRVFKDSDLNDIEENYIRSGGMFELIEDKAGKLLGTYGLYPLDNDICELRKMYFVPEIRGLGLGRQTLERVVICARQLGFKTITLETTGVLKEAIRLYDRFGFVTVPAAKKKARADRTYIYILAE